MFHLLFLAALVVGVLSQGPYVATIADADAWPPGQQLFSVNGNGCNRFYLRITVGGKFWHLQAMNPNRCNCGSGNNCYDACPFGGCSGGSPWPLRVLSPFIVTFHDISQSAEFMLPTRHNSPFLLEAGSTTAVIPQVLDARLPTPLMKVTVRFLTSPTSTVHLSDTYRLCSGSLANQFSFSSNSDESNREWGDHRREHSYTTSQFRDAFAQSSFYYGRWTGTCSSCGDPRIRMWLWRKGPIPPYIMSEYNYNIKVVDVTRGWTRIPEFGSRNPYYITSCFGSCSTCSRSYSITFTYYETVRYYEVSAWVEREGMEALMPNAGDTWEPPVNGTEYDIRLRFGWYNMSRNSMSDPIELRRRFYAVFVLQPFPIQDVWVTVTDTHNGYMLFQDTEAHFPYVRPSSQGQLGWWRAVDWDERWTTSTTSNQNKLFRVMVRFNRRQRIMNGLPTEVRSVMLQDWAHDQGSDVLRIITPIPPSVLQQKDLMGAVARDFQEEGSLVLDIAMNCILDGERADDWMTRSFPQFQSNLTYRKRFHPNWPGSDGANYTHERVKFIQALMVTLNAEEQRGRTWFAYYASFFPRTPTDVPTFWDPAALQRLFGFSEVVRFVHERLQLWREEYEMISHVLPWFPAQHNMERWLSARAYVLRNGYDVNSTRPDGYVQLPVVNLMRRRSESNLALSIGRNNLTTAMDDATTMTHFQVRAMRNISAMEEISVDFNSAIYTKQQYLLDFGAVPATARDATTLPGVQRHLEDSDESRTQVVHELMETHSEDYYAALSRLVSLLSFKMTQITPAVDGLGSSTEVVDMATVILNTERAVTTSQLSAAIAELSMLPPPL